MIDAALKLPLKWLTNFIRITFRFVIFLSTSQAYNVTLYLVPSISHVHLSTMTKSSKISYRSLYIASHCKSGETFQQANTHVHPLHINRFGMSFGGSNTSQYQILLKVCFVSINDIRQYLNSCHHYLPWYYYSNFKKVYTVTIHSQTCKSYLPSSFSRDTVLHWSHLSSSLVDYRLRRWDVESWDHPNFKIWWEVQSS